MSETSHREVQIRVLHDLIAEAQGFPHFVQPYVTFVRALRERLHPVGRKDVREIVTASGMRFGVDLGDRLGCDFYYGYWGEAFEAELFQRLLEAGNTVADVGANFGFYSVGAARRVGPSGRVHAFEPDPGSFALLEANVERNGFDNVECHELGAGDADGDADFYVMEESAFSGLSHTGRASLKETRRVRIARLDTVLAAGSPLHAVKIDVEGHEFAVLAGMTGLLDATPGLTLMVEVSAKNLDAARHQALGRALADLYTRGFRGWAVHAEPDGLRRVERAEDAVGLASANVFFVRAASAAEDRLRGHARDMCREGFTGIAAALGADAAELLRRHAQDPQGGLRLYAALVQSAQRDLMARIAGLEEQVRLLQQSWERSERDSAERLKEIQRLQQRTPRSILRRLGAIVGTRATKPETHQRPK